MIGVTGGSGSIMAVGRSPIARPSRVMTTIDTRYGFSTGSMSGAPWMSEGGIYIPAAVPFLAPNASISDVTPVNTTTSS